MANVTQANQENTVWMNFNELCIPDHENVRQIERESPGVLSHL